MPLSETEARCVSGLLCAQRYAVLPVLPSAQLLGATQELVSVTSTLSSRKGEISQSFDLTWSSQQGKQYPALPTASSVLSVALK